MNPDELNTALAAEETPPVETAQPEETNAAPDTQATETQAEKLYAGKYKSADELEKAYQEIQQVTGNLGQKINDPEFIYQQAQRLGIADQEAPAEEKAAPKDPATPQRAVAQPQVDINTVVKRQVDATLDYNEAIALLPDLKKDSDLRAMAGALVASGKTHVQAAKILQERFNTERTQGVTQGVAQAQSQLTDKERAQTATATTGASTDGDEVATLQAKARNRANPKEQDKAVVELLMRKNRAQT